MDVRPGWAWGRGRNRAGTAASTKAGVRFLKSFASDLTLNYNVIPPSDRQFMSSSVVTGNVREMWLVSQRFT